MKLLYIHIEENYKHIPAGGYSFDKEFNVIEFNTTGEKQIVLETNKSYFHPFNETLNNVSCIVGRNGMGKTTFFELIIAPLLWRLDGESLLGKIHLLFFDEIDNAFYIESYINNAENWHLKVDGTKQSIYKNIYLQNSEGNDKSKKYSISSRRFSVMPFQMNIIFHSLSPFDRIYDLLKLQLSDASDGQKVHYHKRLKYIGIKQIENDETTYEYMTLINLISVLLDDKSKTMFNNLGYEYGKININIENEAYYLEVKLPDYSKFKGDYKKYVNTLFTEESYIELQERLDFELNAYKFDEVFFKEILLKSLKVDTLENFHTLLNIIQKESDDELTSENISDKIYGYIDNINSPKQLRKVSDKETYKLLKEIFENKDDIINLNKFNDNEYLKEIIADGTFLYYLKYLKRLARNNFVSFQMNLFKNGVAFDYLRLSSGEKTLLSYFANILGRIRELDDIQNDDPTYANVKNKTYLILIDEVELHLHPEWQRNFIKQINDFFTYEDESKKFQFVIATHSPFVVTDIFDDNIIYLGGKPDTKTFGGNIFDIFKDDFYVTNSIGAFSEEIIRDLSEILYVVYALKKAQVEENFFMLRDYFDLMYKSDNRNEENKILIRELSEYLSIGYENESFSKISTNRFLPLPEGEDPYKEFSKVINNIGEDVIKEHLQNMLDYIREENA